MLAEFYGSSRQVITDFGLLRVLTLDETTRRVLLGVSTPPGEVPEGVRMTRQDFRKFSCTLNKERVAVPDPIPPKFVPAPSQSFPVNRVKRMMELAERARTKRFA
jgi:hypothetical protein